MSSTLGITVYGVSVDVDFNAYKGYAGSREEPPEPAYVEIEAIRIGKEDITDIVTQQFVDQAQTVLEECLIELENERYCDAPDYNYEY